MATETTDQKPAKKFPKFVVIAESGLGDNGFDTEAEAKAYAVRKAIQHGQPIHVFAAHSVVKD